jgi:hypothetical protein
MQLEEILSELENNTGIFPRLAVERAIEEQAAITPKLLATLEECKNNFEELLENSEYILHIYALYLLAQFREKSAYPIIIDFFSVPGDMAMDVTGDVVTEDLGRIIASVFDGNLSPIKKMIENDQVNEYIRGAGLTSLVVLVAQGIISREEVIQYFEELYSTRLERKPEYIWTNLIIQSSELCAIELKEYIDAVYDEDLIDLFFINKNDVYDSLEIGIEAALTKLRDDKYHSLIEDVISEMQWWACFQQAKQKKTYNVVKQTKGFAPLPTSGKNQASKKTKKNRPKKK